MYNQNAIDVGLGKRKADLVFQGGKLVNVFTAEVYEADVAVAGEVIAAIGDVSETVGEDTQIVDASGMHIVPGSSTRTCTLKSPSCRSPASSRR